MKLLVSYIRWSTKEQDKGDSLNRQVTLIDDFYTKHSEEFYMAPIHRYVDKGKSGFHQKHKEAGGDFKRMIDNVMSGVIPVGSMIVMENFDRASRANVDDAMEDIRQILRKGVTLRTLGEGGEFYDKSSLSDPYQLIKQILIADRAHAESLRKQEHTLKVWKAKTEQARISKKPMGRQTPGWIELNSEGTEFFVNTRKARIAKHIFNLRKSGMSMFAICKRLNRKKIKTINDRKVRISKTHKPDGGGWSAISVKCVLLSKSVIGYLPAKISTDDYKTIIREEIPDYYPRIITDELYYVVQSLLEECGRGKTTSGDHWLYTNIFRTLVRCKCGLAMTPSGIRKPVYQGTYRCNGMAEGRCAYGAVSRKTLDKHLCERLLSQLTQLYGDDVDHSNIEELEREIKVLDEELSNIAEGIARTSKSSHLYLLMDKKQGEQDEYKSRLKKEKIRVNSVMNLNLSMLDMETVKGRTDAHVIIKKVVKSIVVNGRDMLVDVYLHNGNVIEGFSLQGETDHVHTLASAVDDSSLDDNLAMFGKPLMTVYSGADTVFTTEPPDYSDWPECDEDDYTHVSFSDSDTEYTREYIEKLKVENPKEYLALSEGCAVVHITKLNKSK